MDSPRPTRKQLEARIVALERRIVFAIPRINPGEGSSDAETAPPD